MHPKLVAPLVAAALALAVALPAAAQSASPTPVPTGTALPSEPSDFVDVDGWEPAVFADTTTVVE